jgi:hypothetical protein
MKSYAEMEAEWVIAKAEMDVRLEQLHAAIEESE